MSKQRPRSHTIEPEAEWAIGKHLAPWAITKCAADYGRDLTVEVFTERSSGSPSETTGMLFDIQLKATDEEILSKALRARFKVKDLLYYQENDLPILLCLYHAPQDKVYSRWAQTVNVKREQRTQTVAFEGTAWNADIRRVLQDDLDWIRSLKSKSDLPIIIYIDNSELADQMEDYWEDIYALEVTSIPHTSKIRPRIRIQSDRIHTDFGITSFSFYFDIRNAQKDITTAIALILFSNGLDGQAVTLLELSLKDLSPLSPNMLWLFGNEDYSNLYNVCHRLVSCARGDLLCKLLRSIYMSCPSVEDVSAVYDLIKPDSEGNVDFGDIARYTDTKKLVLRELIGNGSVMEMARIAEGFANIITSEQLSEILKDWSYLSHSALCWLAEQYLRLGDSGRAYDAVCSASRIGNMGLDNPVIRRLTGLLAAAEGRTDDAVRELDYARQLGDEQASHYPLLILIDHGRYGEALKRLETLDDVVDADADEVFLLSNVLSHITDVTGVMSQDRETERAIEASILLEGSFEPSQEQYDQYFKRAFDADIAWGSVWFNHATMNQSKRRSNQTIDDYTIALDYLSAAVLCYIDTEAWIGAIVEIFALIRSTGDTEPTMAVQLLQSTIRTALRINGQHLLEKLYRLPIASAFDQPLDRDSLATHSSSAITQEAKDILIEMCDIFTKESRGQGFLWMLRYM